MKKNYKILIVEDSITAMLYTSNIVREAGYNLAEAINGKEALLKLRNDSFDMIISDILMPEMDGFQLLKHVKEDPDLRNIPFIFHTATYNSDKDKDFGFKLGVDAYIHKFKNPTELSELINGIFKELESKKFISNKPKIEQEEEVFKLYSERLINKLEKKILDLEKEIVENKRVEDFLHETENKFDNLLNATTEIAFLAKSDGTFLEVNDALAKSLGKEKNELIGKLMFDVLSGDIAEKRKAMLQKIVTSKKPLQWKDERAGKYFDNNVYPIFDDNGDVMQISVFVKDITSQKKSNDILRQFKKIVDSTSSHMSFIDKNYIYQAVNHSYLKAHKKEREQIAGHSIAEVLGSEIFENQIKGKIDRCFKGESVIYDEWFDFPGIGRRYMNVSYYPYFDKEKQISGVIVDSQDITQRKEAKDKLIEKESHYRQLFDILPYGGEIISTEGIITNCSESTSKMLGYEKDELIGKHITNFVDAGSVEIFQQNFTKILKGESLSLEGCMLHKNGNRIDVIRAAQSILNTDGEVLGMLVLTVDISERKQAEQALLESERKQSSFMNSALDGFFLMDKNLVFQYLNPVSLRNLGMNEEDVLGRSLLDINPEVKNSNRLAAYKKVIETGEPFNSKDFVYNSKSEDLYFSVCAFKVGEGLGIIAKNITERKQAEDSLKESEERYRSIFSNISNIAVQGYDKNRKVTYWNKASETLYGYSQEEVINKKLEDLILPPEIRETVISSINNWHKNNIKIPNGELTLLKKDRSPVQVFSSHVMIEKPTGEKEMFCIDIDITERKQAEEALKSESARFQTTMNSIDAGVYVADMQTHELLFQNENNKKVFGNKLGQKCYVTIQGSDMPCDFCTNNKLLDKNGNPKEPYIWEFQNTITNKWYELRDQAIKWPDGRIVRLEIATDITERKQAGESLKASEEKYRLLTETMKDVVVKISKTGKLLYVSPSIEKFGGYKPKEEIGKHISNYLENKTDLIKALKLLADILITKKSGNFEFLFKPKNKAPFPVEHTYVPLIRNNKVYAIQLVLRDVTEQKKAEKAIQKKNLELLERNEDLDAFSHTVAHEFKNPLGNIIGFTELLIEKCSEDSEDEVKKYLSIIINSGHKMHQIVDSLLLLANIRKAEIVMEKLNMNDIVSVSIERLNLLIEKSKAVIKLPETWPEISGYALWIEEVWINYLSNAIKYGGAPPIIEIGFDTDSSKTVPKGMLRFWVKDNGPGISLENQKILFKKFERLDQVNTEGHGLGLSIVNRIIQKLGGQLGVESELGKGSLFYFTLPYSGKTEKNRTIKNKLSGKNKEIISGKLKLLIVEDNESASQHLSIITSKLSKETLYAANGMDAVKMCKNNPDIDLVLMDVKLPEMNGYEATKQIRKFNKNVIIIAQTAYVTGGDLGKALEVGCNDFISKPIKQAILIEKIERLSR